MTFIAPGWLWALVALPVVALVLWRWGRDRRGAARSFADPALLAVGPGRRVRVMRATAAVLVLLAIASGTIALARPAIDRTDDERRGSVMLAVDSSRSMLKTDLRPSRLEAAKEAIGRFLDAAPKSTAIGLVSFADGARVLVPPVTDREAVRSALEGLDIRVGTAIGDGVTAGLAALRAAGVLEPPLPANPRDAAGRILVLSDGANSAGIDPVQAGERAKAARVPVYSVLLGDDPGRPDQRSPAETLASLATQTGGIYTQSTSTEDLVRVFEDLGGAIVPTERLTEVTVAFAGLAILLLGAAGVLVVLGASPPARVDAGRPETAA